MPSNNSHETIIGVRRTNTRAVLACLQEKGDFQSLEELARETNLSRPTVTQVLRSLCDTGLVERSLGTTKSFGGRPPKLFRIKSEHHATLILRLTLWEVMGFLQDATGRTIAEASLPYEEMSQAGDVLIELAKQLVAQKPEGVPLARTVVVVIGVVRDGKWIRSRNYPDLIGGKLEEQLSPVVECPLVIANDAKLAGYAAHRLLPEDAPDSIVGVHISEAIGCSLVMNGQVVEGAHGAAGEVGTDRQNGWWEAELLLRDATTKRGINNRELFILAGEGEEWAQDVVAKAAGQIARGLVPIVLGFDPAQVVIMGAIEDCGNIAVDAMSAVFNRIVPFPPEVIMLANSASCVHDGARMVAFKKETDDIFKAIMASKAKNGK
ncbi:hypothetical protein BK816_04075 [Boudabousia tangfeifanii]|uniref:Uncharacterized protein n=1 Tax=Boudabousia tangfeifanii TaxID=1912795 RepID=A0A1D9MK63_9ACTO|nr:ROK family protein [Boudabousia tangfeifanii]AOZ72573.1 hypothetical protein BK816_04075 [Boudabousia tangfeifanii]